MESEGYTSLINDSRKFCQIKFGLGKKLNQIILWETIPEKMPKQTKKAVWCSG